MRNVKKLNIKNQTYYFLDDMIDIKNFHSNLLKIDKKLYEDIDIYYTGYITIKKFSNCEDIHSVNPLVIYCKSTGYFKEKNGKKYLVIDLTEKYEEVSSGIRSEIETLNGGKELFYGKDYDRMEISTDGNVPLNKKLKFPSPTIIIRCVFQNGKKLYPQVYLVECLFEL